MTKKRRRVHKYVDMPYNEMDTINVLNDMNNLLKEMSEDISPIKNEWIEAASKYIPLFYSYMGAIEDVYYYKRLEQIKIIDNCQLLFQQLIMLLLLPSRSFVHQRSVWVDTQGHSGVCIHSRIRHFLHMTNDYQTMSKIPIIYNEIYKKLKNIMLLNEYHTFNKYNSALNKLLEYQSDSEASSCSSLSPSHFLLDTNPLPKKDEVISCPLLQVDDIVEYILSFLCLKDLCYALCTCKCFFRVGQHTLIKALSEYFSKMHTLKMCRHLAKSEEFSYKGLSTLSITIKEGECTDTVDDMVGHCRYRYVTNNSRVPLIKQSLNDKK